MARCRGGSNGGDGPAATSVVRLGSRSDVGRKRNINQDSLCALVGPNAPSGTQALLAVADGMGGHQAGEVASAMAIRGLVSKLSAGGGTPSTGGPAPVLQRTISDLNAEIHAAAGRPETRGMGTTLTAAVIIGDALTLGHVGDSRAYLLRDGALQQLTKDHSWVAEQVARGAITPEEAEEHPQRNILTRALGVEPRVQADATTIQLKAGDLLMLCSDGLHGLVKDEEIGKVLGAQDPGPASREMVDLANARGGPDNITVVVARIESIGPPSQASQAAHLLTTVSGIVRATKKRGLAGKVARVLLAPLWLPFWILYRLFIAPLRQRR